MKKLMIVFIMLCSITLYSQDTIVKRALRSPYLLDWSLITNDTISYLLGLDGENIYKSTNINNNLSVTGNTKLGNAITDTTAITGTTIHNATDTTGKVYGRIVPRWAGIVSSATPSVNSDKYDSYDITLLATDITNFTTTGTPTNFQKLYIRITPDATPRTIAWDAAKFVTGIVTLPATTVASKTLSVLFIYNINTSKWVCQAAGNNQ